MGKPASDSPRKEDGAIEDANREGGGKAPPPMPEAARRALAEAEARRRQAEAQEQPAPRKEINGRKGPDPARYGDWEKKGIAIDF